MNRLKAQQVEIGYGDHSIINNLDVEIPDGKVTSIIGPNGWEIYIIKSIVTLINNQKW